jgi:hypothetical protein
MIKEERKKYPSELNTKSIACRIPMNDYVEIMNECVNKGISINDWLLMKLYQKNGLNVSMSGTDNSEENEVDFQEFTIETPRGEYTFQDTIDVETTINHLISENDNWTKRYIEMSRDFQEMNLDDERIRNRIYLKIIDRINSTDWATSSDRISCRKEFKSIWKDLFD